MPETIQNMDIKTTQNMNIKQYVRVAYVVVTLIALAKLSHIGYTKRAEYNVARKDAICPALFSISRSARDTLIVMKSEPLCNDYALSNLK
jgi:hypothetical protein